MRREDSKLHLTAAAARTAGADAKGQEQSPPALHICSAD
jgi:hypothetical protein